MLNQVVIVGRLIANSEIKNLELEKSVSNITLAVPRVYKNENGEYDTDFIDCELWNTVAINTADYCKKGDIIGVKGRIKIDYYDKDSGRVVFNQNNKVIYLASQNKQSLKEICFSNYCILTENPYN